MKLKKGETVHILSRRMVGKSARKDDINEKFKHAVREARELAKDALWSCACIVRNHPIGFKACRHKTIYVLAQYENKIQAPGFGALVTITPYYRDADLFIMLFSGRHEMCKKKEFWK